jgi:hypothetical protein
MTEADWLACNDTHEMLRFLGWQVSNRKLRLCSCACIRLLWPQMQDQRSRRAVEVAEHFADGLVSPQDLLAAQHDAEKAHSDLVADSPQLFRRYREAARTGLSAATGLVNPITALAAAFAAKEVTYPTFPTMYDDLNPEASLLDCIMIEIAESPGNGLLPLDGPVRDILGNPFRVATSPDPTWLLWNNGAVRRVAEAIYRERRFDDCPILADALEEAGCTSLDLLGHLRGPGPHVLGCHGLDAVLGKS